MVRGRLLKSSMTVLFRNNYSTIFEISKVFFAADTSCSQKTADDVHVDGIVGRDNYRAVDSRLDISPVGTFLSMEFEPKRQKNALDPFPVNWG